MKQYLILSLLSFSLIAPVFAGTPKPDLFFSGTSDLVFQTDELSVGKKISCNLSVHYDGKDPVQALVKVYSDGTNITSFPVEFKSPGEQVGNFSFRVEREGKHHLEFVILTSGELQEKQFENNRMSVTFEVPGPGRGVVTAPVSTVSKPEAVPFPPTVADSVKEDEGEDRGLNQEDAADYLEQPELDYEENVVPPELMTKVFSSGKPLVDVFFSGNDALKLKKSNLKDSRAISWELVVQSNGTGEGEIEIVVADGNKKIITQHVWLRGGETLHIPMQATFDRSGPHRLTAMINTQNNIVDRNMENNILEQTIQVE